MKNLALVLCALLAGCQCSAKVDETAQEAARQATGAATVERGAAVKQAVVDGVNAAEKARDDKADELLKKAKE